ncbi:MAG: Gfo/Idh/MocA family oxidoreductase, partial [Sulfitobacter sp.]
MLRIGILGCGRIGQVHARSLMRMKDAALIAVADAFPAAAQSLADQTGAEIRDVAAIIEAADIDAVIICTPTDTHYDLIHAAAKAGKAIFCEKPVDMS